MSCIVIYKCHVSSMFLWSYRNTIFLRNVVTSGRINTPVNRIFSISVIFQVSIGVGYLPSFLLSTLC